MHKPKTVHGIDLSAPGGIEALFKFHRAHFGTATMEGPTDPPAALGNVQPETISVPVPQQPVIDASNPAVAALIEQARQQEKAKLYGQIENLTQKVGTLEPLAQTVQSLQAEQEAKIAAATEQARKEAEEAARKQWEENDAKTLLQQKDLEWEQRFQKMQADREAERAAFEKERSLQELKQFTQATVAKAIENNEIAPELAHLVTGNNVEEISASLETIKATSEQIATNMASALQAQQVQRRGVAPTGYAPVGPMDMTEQTRTLTADQIRDMPMSEYVKLRGSLPGVNQHQSNRGLFG